MMRHRRIVLGFAFCCAATALASAALAQTPAPATGSEPSLATPTPATTGFTFAWPVPGVVRIEKYGEKRGNKVRMRYHLDVTPDGEQNLRIRQRDFEFLEVNGLDTTTAEGKKQMAPALALTQAVPDMLIDCAGSYLRIDGIEAMVERVAAHQSESKGMSAAESERLLKSMRSPTMLSALQESCGADWTAWVGAWVGFDVPAGESREGKGVVPVFGASVPADVVWRHHGEVAEHPGHVRLSMTATVDGDEGSKAAVAAMTDMAKKVGIKPPAGDEPESIRVVTRLEVILEPKTLRPLRAERHKDMRIVMKGKPPSDQVERLEFTFVFEPAPAAK